MPVLPQNTIAALTTPPGQGAISVIEVHGPDAWRVIQKIFRPSGTASASQPLRLAHGTLRRDDQIVDEVLVRIVPSAESFTGEESVEIHGHGGSAPAEAIFGLLEQHSIPRVPWPALVDRACLNGKIDAIQAEAYRLLPGALTPLAAMVLQDQAQGALSRAVRDVRTADDVRRLLASATLGCALTAPLRIVIAGRPNVGKSTLFNALLEAERALVTPEAGTTRDPVTAVMAIDGVPFTLVDTAGIGKPIDSLDDAGQKRAREEMTAADLVLIVLETGGEPSSEEKAFVRSLEGRPHLTVFNKRDLVGHRGAILEALDLQPPSRPAAPMVFTHRQRQELAECINDPSRAKNLLDTPKA